MVALSGYVKIGAKPSENDLIAEYYFEPARGVAPAYACEQLAAESSIGTWTAIATLKPQTARRLAPKIFYLKKKGNGFIARIAYPDELFEASSVPQLMSAIGGNVFGMRIVRTLRLNDFSLPRSLVKTFKGPQLGVSGVRKMLRIPKRPLCGTIIKPKVGLNEREHAAVAYECWVNGLDLVKDDENLTSMRFNNFEKRLTATLEAMDRAQSETNERKIYVCNVSAETKEMLRRAQLVHDQGGNCTMIDVLTCGWSALQTLRDANLRCAIHAHRAGHAAVTRNPRHGISMLAIAKLCRLIGVDSLHVGAIFGKMQSSASETLAITNEIQAAKVKANPAQSVLAQNWFGLASVFAVASGGLHPGVLDKVVAAMGNDVFLQAGGGVHGHPSGSAAGARATRQAVDAINDGISLREYALEHVELKCALEKWGTAYAKRSG
ncbi:MAG: type III ribulose-bisphosphate carboxylase [Candidatus Norongarragalinales archaeon]